VVFIGSVFAILCGALMVLGSVVVSHSNRMANQPPFLRYFMFIDAVVCFVFGAWGLASGVGLIKLKQPGHVSDVDRIRGLDSHFPRGSVFSGDAEAGFHSRPRTGRLRFVNSCKVCGVCVRLRDMSIPRTNMVLA
jgi:hypothetical protein